MLSPLAVVIDRSEGQLCHLLRKGAWGKGIDLKFQTPCSRSRIATNLGVLGNDLLFLILPSYHNKLLVVKKKKISTKEGGGA